MQNIQMFFHALFQCVKWVFVLFFHVYLQIYFVFEIKSHAQHSYGFSCSFSLRIFKYVLFITTLKHIFALQNSLGGDENGHLVVGAALPRPELVLWKATSLVWPAKVLRRGDDKTRILILGKEKREKVVPNKDLTEFALPDGPLKNLALRAAFKEASSSS